MARSDDLIAAQRDVVADMERKLEIERGKLAGMEAMARAFGAAASARVAASMRVGGRQPGSITKTWRRVLGSLVMREGDWFDASDVVNVYGNLTGREIRASEVRRNFKTYEENGYVETNDRGQFRVTDEAVAKFGLGNEPQAEATADENEEEEGDTAAKPSDESGPDAGTSEPLTLVNPYGLVGQRGG